VSLKEAWEFLEEARRELERARGGSLVAARDAAEKAWNAVVQAADALVVELLGRRPKSHRERRDALWEIERRVPGLDGIYDRYNARFQRLHGEMFYEGLLDLGELEKELIKAEEFVKKVEEFLRARDAYSRAGALMP